MHSMTGYGMGVYSNDEMSIKIEMKSVNNRYCDIAIRLPRNLISLEDKIKRIIKSKVNRGKVDVFINIDYINSTNVNIIVNTALAEEYYNALTKLNEQLNLNGKISLKDIYSMQGVLVNQSGEENVDEYFLLIEKALNQALDNFLNMRSIEGENLKKDFSEKIKNICEIMEVIKERAPLTLEENIKKLKDTIEQNVEVDKLDISRLSTEVAIMSDKLSIDEEITRIKLHLEQFSDIINLDGAIGRKLDFLIQELNREVNTIGSKTTDITILNSVVNLKSEIEKIREQIQNIE
ncbi:TIGR00255 family protein [Anaerosphaera aminiphila DSM 21120]|uniref:TIGR00255 family protein n=1 Tax=Anaerosphaera aminiphila DSM 21120 TaxID=1120995 RepID=A0A1M5SZJ5_9FIRM|nr:TIGR00255 family protein [Anaerosphaera aminiphila DSM 21120]